MSLKKDFKYSGDVSILSSGCNIEGTFNSSGNVRIDGSVKGDVIINGNLTVGEGAVITGNVTAKNVTLCGNVQGGISAEEKVVLESKSYLKGNLIAKILLIEEGAKFDGMSNMTSNDSSEQNEN